MCDNGHAKGVTYALSLSDQVSLYTTHTVRVVMYMYVLLSAFAYK